MIANDRLVVTDGLLESVIFRPVFLPTQRPVSATGGGGTVKGPEVMSGRSDPGGRMPTTTGHRGGEHFVAGFDRRGIDQLGHGT